MANGAGIIVQSRLRPIRSGPSGATGNGLGISYGFGTGVARLAGITYSYSDSSGQYNLGGQSVVARLAVINGDYAASAVAFTPTTDLATFDVLYDVDLNTAGPITLPTWFSGIVSDAGISLTVLLSQLTFPGGAPAGVLPVAKLLLHADHFKPSELALSPGAISTL